MRGRSFLQVIFSFYFRLSFLRRIKDSRENIKKPRGVSASGRKFRGTTRFSEKSKSLSLIKVLTRRTRRGLIGIKPFFSVTTRLPSRSRHRTCTNRPFSDMTKEHYSSPRFFCILTQMFFLVNIYLRYFSAPSRSWVRRYCAF